MLTFKSPYGIIILQMKNVERGDFNMAVSIPFDEFKALYKNTKEQEQYIERYAKRFLKLHWGITELPKFSYVSYKPQTKKTKKVHSTSVTGGSFSAYNNQVKLNRYLLIYFAYTGDKKILINILSHELTHYALWYKGEPNGDGHPHFESELKRVGSVSSAATKEDERGADEISMPIYKHLCVITKDGQAPYEAYMKVQASGYDEDATYKFSQKDSIWDVNGTIKNVSIDFM